MAETKNARQEVGSIDWVNALRRYLEEQVPDEDLVGVTCAASFELTDPPTRLLTDGRDKVGWFIRVQNGRLDVGDRPLSDADVWLVADYDSMAPTFLLTNEEDIEFMSNGRLQLVAEGKYEMGGDPAPFRPIMIKANLREGFYNVYSA